MLPLNGILNLHKPPGITSRQAVDHVARLAGRSKVGHAGTLDPLASGVLVVCVGSATRLIESIQGMAKTYRATILLGARSDTLDALGKVTLEDSPRPPALSDIQRAIQDYQGEIWQRPPSFSALKVKGRRAYDLARSGQPIDLPPRRIRIDRVELVDYSWPRLQLEIECGGGTYIRSLAADLGEALGCGGLLEALIRSRIGPFDLATACTLEELTPATFLGSIRPPLEAVAHLPRVVLSESLAEDVRQGRPIAAGPPESDPACLQDVVLVTADGSLVAIAEWDVLRPGWLQPRKVFR
jgi:tRNA pseudouridine55 synthase